MKTNLQQKAIDCLQYAGEFSHCTQARRDSFNKLAWRYGYDAVVGKLRELHRRGYVDWFEEDTEAPDAWLTPRGSAVLREAELEMERQADEIRRRGDWIQTYSGVHFFPFDPQPCEIHIADIAHALSNICRFTGHVRQFYSVAEHCVHVSHICHPDDAMWGLLHDASEAYICDIARPIKQRPDLAGYCQSEKHLQSMIARRFGLSEVEPASVGVADKMMLGIEARDLMHSDPCWRKWQEGALSISMAPMKMNPKFNVRSPLSPHEAKLSFLGRFENLSVGRML